MRTAEADPQDDSYSLVEDYLGIGRSTMVSLLVIIVFVLVVATGIYISVFGFQHWKNNMKRAGDAMVINFNGQAAVGQYYCPNCGQVGLPVQGAAGTPICPVCRAKMGIR